MAIKNDPTYKVLSTVIENLLESNNQHDKTTLQGCMTTCNSINQLIRVRSTYAKHYFKRR